MCPGRAYLQVIERSALEWPEVPLIFSKKHGVQTWRPFSPPELSFHLELSVAFLPACFQFARVASFDCDLNPIRKERVRWARGKSSRRRFEGSAERRGRERIEAREGRGGGREGGAFRKIALCFVDSC